MNSSSTFCTYHTCGKSVQGLTTWLASLAHIIHYDHQNSSFLLKSTTSWHGYLKLFAPSFFYHSVTIPNRIYVTSHFLATWLLPVQRKYWNSEGFWLQSLPIHPISMATMLPTALTIAPVPVFGTINGQRRLFHVFTILAFHFLYLIPLAHSRTLITLG